MDLESLPFHRALNVVYAMILRNKDEESRSKFLAELNRPMPGEGVDSQDPVWGQEALGSAFMALMSMQEKSDA